MTYNEYLAASKAINETVNTLTEKVNSYEWRTESVRLSDEFKALNNKFRIAFKKLQDFNKSAPKGFSKRKAKEVRAAKIAANNAK